LVHNLAVPFDQPPRTPWQAFPEVLILASERAIKNHREYIAAKLGDVAAAARLIDDVMGDDAYATIERALSGRQPTVVAVHAIERDGINRIPAVLGHAIAEHFDLPLDSTVVQINRVSHTGASGWHRLAFPPLFDGNIVVGEQYLLVDDFVGQGGTLANLKGFIESRGGTAILVSR
jgi:adenine/guanine phosphoribosyltransferase-like PRPP-binding protein